MARKPDPFLIDDENPAWTFKGSRPAKDVHPKLVQAFKAAKRGRPPKPNCKEPVSFRLDPDLIMALRSIPGYQTRINTLLRNAIARRSPVLFGDKR